MAKKKKQETTTAQDVSNASTNTSTNSIRYRGKVQIELVRGNKTIKKITSHNRGTSELFRILANTLVGINESSSMPTYIHLYNSTATQGEVSCCVLSVFYSSRRVYRENDTYNVELVFFVPYSQLDDSISNSINVLRLFGSPEFITSRPLAEITLDSDEEIPIESSTNVAITWILTLQNA